MMRAALLVALVLVFAPPAGASPPFRPDTFVARVDNPWFPLAPGTVYVYRGVKDGKPSRDVVTVTHAATPARCNRSTSVALGQPKVNDATGTRSCTSRSSLSA